MQRCGPSFYAVLTGYKYIEFYPGFSAEISQSLHRQEIVSFIEVRFTLDCVTRYNPCANQLLFCCLVRRSVGVDRDATPDAASVKQTKGSKASRERAVRTQWTRFSSSGRGGGGSLVVPLGSGSASFKSYPGGCCHANIVFPKGDFNLYFGTATHFHLPTCQEHVQTTFVGICWCVQFCCLMLFFTWSCGQRNFRKQWRQVLPRLFVYCSVTHSPLGKNV